LHFLHGYVARAADDEMAAMLVELLPSAKGMDRHWIVRAMLAGWGRDHVSVKASLDPLIERGDEGLIDLAALVPQLDGDPARARSRLLRLSSAEKVRRDLLATGLSECGCDHRDDAAVASILKFNTNAESIFDPVPILFRSFAEHPRVRALARERLNHHDPPLSALAEGYANDPEFAQRILAAAAPLPVELRTQIVEVATVGAAGTALEGVLSRWEQESDAELRVRMAIAYFDSSGITASTRTALLEGALQVGPEFETRRAAAFAGLIMTNGLKALADLEDRGEKVRLETGGFLRPIPSLERLICERLDDLRDAFGESLADRFSAFEHKNRLAEILARAPDASRSARREFLNFADTDALPRTPATLRALATVAPGSKLLLDRCIAALDTGDRHNDRVATEAEIGLILRAEFPGNEEVRNRLIQRFENRRSVRTVTALAVFCPASNALPTNIDHRHLGREFGEWAPAMHIAAWREDAASFAALVDSMVTRPRRSQFDAQGVVNIAIEERLARDPELVSLFSDRIDTATNASISASAARYLASAGTFGSASRARASELLSHLARGQSIPVAAYDAVADRWRSARASFLDALYAGLEIN
jgi:hypothetical protein